MGKERKRDLTEAEKHLIEGYFNEKLTPVELKQFQELMKDASFADWVDKYRQAALMIDSLAEQELLKDLEMDIEQIDEVEILKAFSEYPLLLKRIQQMLRKKDDEDSKS